MRGVLFHAACLEKHRKHCLEPPPRSNKRRSCDKEDDKDSSGKDPDTDRPDYQPRLEHHRGHQESVRVGYKSRKLRDGGGKTSPGRLAPHLRAAPLVRLGSLIIRIAFTWTPMLLESLAKGDTVHPFSVDQLDQIREVLAPKSFWGVNDGQPFHLDEIQYVASLAADNDSQFPIQLKGGVDLGVDSPTWNTPGIWPTKEEMRGMEWIEEDPPKTFSQGELPFGRTPQEGPGNHVS